MKLIITLAFAIFSVNLLAVCEQAKLNITDTIYEGYICKATSIIGAKKIDDLCIIKAETQVEEGLIYKYTHMETKASNDNGWSNHYSTFKWHHKKNNPVSKMWDTINSIRMKDITATDFMKANIYKVSSFDKRTKKVKIEVYKKKNLIGIKKHKWYSATFNCENIN